MKRKLIWLHKSASFNAAEEFEEDYYKKMSPLEKIETVQLLREEYFKMKKGIKNDRRKRLRRSIKIIQQAQG